MELTLLTKSATIESSLLSSCYWFVTTTPPPPPARGMRYFLNIIIILLSCRPCPSCCGNIIIVLSVVTLFICVCKKTLVKTKVSPVCGTISMQSQSPVIFHNPSVISSSMKYTVNHYNIKQNAIYNKLKFNIIFHTNIVKYIQYILLYL